MTDIAVGRANGSDLVRQIAARARATIEDLLHAAGFGRLQISVFPARAPVNRTIDIIRNRQEPISAMLFAIAEEREEGFFRI